MLVNDKSNSVFEPKSHAKGPTNIFVDQCASRAFKVSPEVRVLAKIEVGTDPVFEPGCPSLRFQARQSDHP